MRIPRSARRPAALLTGVVAALLSAVVTIAPAPARADLANQIFDDTPRPLGPISVIGDSVLQGALIYSPTVVSQLAGYGWGPIRAWAGVGVNTRTSGSPNDARAPYRVELWRSQGWDPVDVFVNLGANDSGICNTNIACARTAIMRMVDTIGPGHRIWWPMITRHPVYQHQADTWNAALLEIDAERDDFFTWDWPTVMATGGFQSVDNTHLTPSGYRIRSAMMATEVTADLARARPAGATATLPAPAGDPSVLVPLTSARVLDTRADGPSPVAAGHEVVVDVAAAVPEGTTAVAVYVSATNTTGPGYVTAYECGTVRPTASNANYQAGETRGALTIVPVTTDRTFCLFTHAAADLLADVQGAFVPTGGAEGLRLGPLAAPDRLADTREGGRQNPLVVSAPEGAQALALNVTAVAGAQPGYLVAYPCGDTPPVSATVNYLAGDAVAGAAFVPVGDDGTVCVYSSADTAHVVVDLTATFSPDDGLEFVPAPPTRTIDTRDGTGGWSPIHGAAQTLQARVAPPAAAAVSGTLTINAPLRPGFLTAFGCTARPPTSNVNAPAGATFANFVTTGSPSGELCVYALATGQSIFDTTGWWVAR